LIFSGAYIARFPRRSGEALWAQLMEAQFLNPHDFPKNASFPELYDWLEPRIEAEKRTGKQAH